MNTTEGLDFSGHPLLTIAHAGPRSPTRNPMLYIIKKREEKLLTVAHFLCGTSASSISNYQLALSLPKGD